MKIFYNITTSDLYYKSFTIIFYDCNDSGQYYKIMIRIVIYDHSLSHIICDTEYMLLASIPGFRIAFRGTLWNETARLPTKKFYDKHSSLFCGTLDEEERMFCKIDTCGQCYKTFYGWKLQFFHNKQEHLSLASLSSLV